LGAVITRTCALAGYLEARILAEPRLELMAPVQLNIVCFRYRAADANKVNGDIVIDIQESGIAAPSTTLLSGQLAIARGDRQSPHRRRRRRRADSSGAGVWSAAVVLRRWPRTAGRAVAAAGDVGRLYRFSNEVGVPVRKENASKRDAEPRF